VPSILLWPTEVLEDAWRVLVLETSLYNQLVTQIHAFHGQNPSRPIPYSFAAARNITPEERAQKIQRTQSLFCVYFEEQMPATWEDCSLSPVLELRMQGSWGGGPSSPKSLRTQSTTALTEDEENEPDEIPFLATPPYDNTPVIFMCKTFPAAAEEQEDTASVTSDASLPLYGLGFVDAPVQCTESF